MANLQEALDAAMASQSATQVSLANSGWLYDRTIDQIEALESDYEEQYERHLAQAHRQLGPPAYDDGSDRDAVDAWYPEAVRFAGWSHRDGLIFLALEHHDRETPVALLVGYASQDDIDERSA